MSYVIGKKDTCHLCGVPLIALIHMYTYALYLHAKKCNSNACQSQVTVVDLSKIVLL